MASQKFRDFRRFSSVALLLPAFLTFNIALNAQNRSDASRLRQALGLTSGKDDKSSINFNRMVADQMVAANAAPLATTASATLPKPISRSNSAAR